MAGDKPAVRHGWLLLVLLASVTFGALGWLWEKTYQDPEIPFLPPLGSAEWITYPTPPNPLRWHVVELDAVFQKSFELKEVPLEAILSVRGFSRVEISINGLPVEFPNKDWRNWKPPRKSDVLRQLRIGRNKIVATVYNDTGPPALWLSLATGRLLIETDSTWNVNLAGSFWKTARLASTPLDPSSIPYRESLPNLHQSLRSHLPVLAGFGFMSAILLAGISLFVRWTRSNHALYRGLTEKGFFAGAVIIVCVLWTTLFLNNISSLSPEDGFDAKGHLAYIQYILDHGNLPQPHEGWAMFHPPMFYAISALLLTLVGGSTFDENSLQILHLQGLFFGLMQVIFVAACLRLIFPGNVRSQAIGIVLAGFLPMQLTLYQFVTNETMAATLASASLYLTLRILRTERPSIKIHAALGACLGAAMLTKFSSFIVFVAVFAVLSGRLLYHRKPVMEWLRSLGVAVPICLAVCGWRFASVWVRYGNPFYGTWKPAFGPPSWQDPGVTSASYYLRFGRSLIDPYFSGLWSFWDGIYSTLWGDGLIGGKSEAWAAPPWNYDLMTVGYTLALVLTLGILIGLVAALARLVRKPDAAWFLLVIITGCLVFSLLYTNMRIANYVTVKAFYAMSGVVPLCALLALGSEVILKRRSYLSWPIMLALGIWAMNSYATFWVIRDSPAAHARLGRMAVTGEEREEIAEQHLSAALEADPDNALAQLGKVLLLNKRGKVLEAVTEVRKLLEAHPDHALGQKMLAIYLDSLSLADESAAHARRAAQLEPGDQTTWYLLGKAEIQRGEEESAARALRQSLRIAPTYTDAHQSLATLLESQGKVQEAAYHFRLAQQKPKLR